MDHLFNNGTAYKIQYIYNLDKSSLNDNRAFSFMKVHEGCGLLIVKVQLHTLNIHVS